VDNVTPIQGVNYQAQRGLDACLLVHHFGVTAPGYGEHGQPQKVGEIGFQGSLVGINVGHDHGLHV
jgi:hypothetical protein